MTWEIRQGDCRELLAAMPDESVQCVVTSPPYFGLRDYGVEGQIGLEATPDEYVAGLVGVFREVRRVLRDDGTLWLNLGDSYASNGGRDAPYEMKRAVPALSSANSAEKYPEGGRIRYRGTATKGKDLIGIPWRVAFALQADGWWLRSDIIWSKPNPMPESVTDRPTSAHEHVFLLAKSARYFYDADAIREPHSDVSLARARRNRFGGKYEGSDASEHGALKRGNGYGPDGDPGVVCSPAGRNKRNVWEIATQPYPEAHFATFPPKLVEPCVLAGSRPAGALIEPEYIDTPTGERTGDDPSLLTGRAGMNRPRGESEGSRRITVAEQRDYADQLRLSPHRSEMEAEAGPAFSHYLRTDASGARPIPPALLERWIHRGWLIRSHAPEPAAAAAATAVVLDPFAGAGTVGVVALRHGRSFIGLELNPDYCELARERIRGDAPLLNTPAELAA